MNYYESELIGHEVASMFSRPAQWGMVEEAVELNGKPVYDFIQRCQTHEGMEDEELTAWIAESADMLEDRPCAHMLRMDECLSSGEALEAIPELAAILVDRKAEASRKEYLLNNPMVQKPLGVHVNRHHEAYSI